MLSFIIVALAGILLGVVGTYVGFGIYRRKIEEARNSRTRTELQGDKVSTVAQVLHFAIQSSPDAVVVVDRRKQVVMSNPRAHELGVVHERVINDVVWSVVSRVFGDGEMRTLHFSPTKQRRGARPILAVAGSAQLLTQADNRYVVIYAVDDSEHTRMESARRDFVANVSHELKTPVGAISLMAETLLEVHDEPDAVQHFASKLSGEVRRMNQMINELISLSKLQGAESLPELEVLSVDKIISDAVERCRLAAETSNIELTMDGPSRSFVRGDLNLLVTSVANLIANAIAYSPEGSTVSITREIHAEMILIRVTDRGIGIALEDQERVFERFFRVDKARSRNTGGTGLGLSIVKHVMANHGGSVFLWSRPGSGSTFTLELPRYKAPYDRHVSGSEIETVVPDANALDGDFDSTLLK